MKTNFKNFTGRIGKVLLPISHEDALRNAPRQANGLFIVPKIVE
jgi:Asp-tRNA(Asn)/Glu-tRNA(Gln) amidotransferase C subunit